MANTDLLILGAGPAGMAAAETSARLGIKVAIVDEQPAAGGQIYRAVQASAGLRGDILGKDYLHGLNLVNALSSESIRHEKQATVWRVDKDGTVAYSQGGKTKLIQARNIIIATGALERPTPTPGWTQPGVMTAGAAQIMLKQSAIIPSSCVVVGSGPLVYLIASQLIRAGQPPLALIETQTHGDMLRAFPYFPAALRAWPYFVKGVSMLLEIRKVGVKRFRGAKNIRIEKHKGVRIISFECANQVRRIECRTVLLHQGVVPNTQITRSLRLEHIWDHAQHCFHPRLDKWGATSIANIYVAGDGARIGGAKVAEHAGRLAALKVASSLGSISKASKDQLAAPLFKALRAELSIRPFLDAAYPPSREILWPEDETIICRCEEVTAGEIRRCAKLGCTGPNQTKAYTRCGMGACQGRFCGLTVTELLAQINKMDPSEVGYYRIRAPLKPITLGELANLADGN